MNAIHWTLLFILNAHGGVTGIVSTASTARDFAVCQSDSQETARVMTEQTGRRTAGTCVTLTGSQMALGMVHANQVYDCDGVSSDALICSGRVPL